MSERGHWFCTDCEQAVCLPLPVGRWDRRHGVACPLCHKKAADWINDTPVKPVPVSLETGQQLFAQMKEQLK